MRIATVVFLCAFVASDPRGESGPSADRTRIAVEALQRLKGMDLEANPALKAAVLRTVESIRGTPEHVELVRDFKVEGQEPALLEYAVANGKHPAAVDAVRLLVNSRASGVLTNALLGTNVPMAVTLVDLLGKTGERQVAPLLQSLVRPGESTRARAAVRALAKTQDGAQSLLQMAREETLPDEVKLVAATELQAVRWPQIKQEAAVLLPMPQTRNAEALPPLGELLKRSGDPERGKAVFFREEIACSTCHQINGRGVNFGPNLSEIGAKLGKDALYEAILDPSSGISFGYEGWEIELKSGDEAFGIIVSDSASELALKAQSGAVTKYAKSEVVKRNQVKTSVMPAGLQQAMSVPELVDLVEYLATRKQAAPEE